MSYVPIEIPPGVVLSRSEYQARGRWVESNRIRFVGGQPEKIGGWAKILATALTGVCRGIYGWRDTTGNRRAAYGTHKKLQTLYDGTLYDLTPVRATGTFTDKISTTSGSPIVNINHTAHGNAAGSYVLFASATAVGGITISGEYTVTTVVDANNFTITHSSNASSTAGPLGGTPTYTYLLTNGLVDDGESPGYGSGGYGLGPYGIGSGAGLPVNARTWTLDNYGQNLIAVPRGGGVYSWAPPVGTPSTRAAALTGAPTVCAGAFVTDERIVIAYGVTTVAAGSGATGSKMLVQGCSDTDNTDWVATAANTAFSRTMAGGNELIGHAKLGSGRYLIFSDIAAFLFQYTGDALVYASRRLSKVSGLLGPKAAAELGGVVYWMARDGFWMCDGAVPRQIPTSDIWPYVFRDINLAQKNKCHAAVNSKFNEVWFFWCSGSASEIDRYAIVNASEGVLAVGLLARTAWFERDLFENPQATDPNSYIYYHESGSDDDGAAMGDYITSAPADIQDGNALLDIDKFAIDMDRITGSALMTLYTRDKPAGTQTTNGPYTITSATTEIDPDPRIDGRQAAVRVASTGIGSDWRLGKIRANIGVAGSRL